MGTALVVGGLAIMEVLNTKSYRIDVQMILLSVILVILYGLGSYFVYLSSARKENEESNIFFLFLTKAAVIGLIMLASGGFHYNSAITPAALIEATLTGALLMIALLMEFKSFHSINKSRTKFINLINIFLNFETVWVLIFSVIFLSIFSTGIVIGVLVTSLGIWLVAAS